MYCVDTYAFIELLKQNINYQKLLDKDFVLTDWTLTELYWVLLKNHNQKTADYWFKKLIPYVQKPSFEDLSEAMKFRLKNKQRKLSHFDCVAYIFSKNNNLVFLTGDKEFETFEQVKFVK